MGRTTNTTIGITTVASASLLCRSQAQEQPSGPNASKTPHYTFFDTLDTQLEELKTNPLLERFRQSRARLLQDPHHPVYHFTSPENRLNDPYGLCFWNGRSCAANGM